MQTAKEPRRYVTEKMLTDATAAKNIGKLPYRVQISTQVTLSFGTEGVSLNRYFSNSADHKWVNYWYRMNAKEINRAFAEQEWEVCY